VCERMHMPAQRFGQTCPEGVINWVADGGEGDGRLRVSYEGERRYGAGVVVACAVGLSPSLDGRVLRVMPSQELFYRHERRSC
jgi:hypothetical protein